MRLTEERSRDRGIEGTRTATNVMKGWSGLLYSSVGACPTAYRKWRKSDKSSPVTRDECEEGRWRGRGSKPQTGRRVEDLRVWRRVHAERSEDHSAMDGTARRSGEPPRMDRPRSSSRRRAMSPREGRYVGPLTRDAASAAGSATIRRETEEADRITRERDLGRGEQ